jgi:Zn-dependent peptidase ImmA (M78 family)
VARRWIDSESVRYFLKKYQRATIEEAVEAAAQLVREPMLAGMDRYCRIPVDLNDVAHRVGVEIGTHLESTDARLGALVLEKGKHSASIGTEGTAGQDRFTLAHEIGHRLFREGTMHAIESLSIREKEAEDKVCEMFAAALLMPSSFMPSVIEQIPGDGPWDILESIERAARQFGVSLPAMVFRVGQFSTRKSPSLILLCLSYFPNRFTRIQPSLRVWICSRLGNLRSVRTWYNRSTHGLGIEAADLLFEQWAKVCGEPGEPTGGRYVLGNPGELTRASRQALHWVPQRLNVSIFSDGLWRKCSLDLQVASCLYARKGWKANRAYIVAIARKPA